MPVVRAAVEHFALRFVGKMTVFMSPFAILFAGYSQYLEAVAARIHCYVILPFKCHPKGCLAGAFKAAF